MESLHYPLIAPGEILNVEGITHSDIVVYAVLYGLMQLKGYCWATNSYLAVRLNISERTVQRHLKNLQDLSLIRIESVNALRKIYPVNDTTKLSQPTTNLTQDTTELSPQNDPSIFLIKKDNKKASKADFEKEILEEYKNYPLKKGKTIGVKKLTKQIKTPEDLELLKTAIRNYSDEVKSSDRQYIKHFSTFASCWQDYIEISEFKKSSGFVAMKFVDGKLVPVSEEE